MLAMAAGAPPLARSLTQRGQLHAQRCSILPSGFQTPRTQVLPQTQSLGPGGAGGTGAGEPSRASDAAARATAAAARGRSLSICAGSDESQTSHATTHRHSIAIS